MFASRASQDRPLTPREPALSSGAMWLHDLWLARDARWIAGMAFVYALAVVAAVFTLNPYFSQTWDAITFTHAARSFLSDGGWMGLYAQSRIERYWPYAYPPLHALVIAPLLAVGAGIPDWFWVRVPPLVADLATGLLLYAIIARRTREQWLARLAFLVWLLNPVTFYDTAVQGHFEAEWLFFVLLAYWLGETRRGILFPTLALACGFLFKQTAIIFAVPYWIKLIVDARGVRVLDPGGRSSGRAQGALLQERAEGSVVNGVWGRHLLPAFASVALFVVVVLVASLPFLLYSGDYVYMTLNYVAAVPLQTQSWLVGLAGLFGPDFWFLRLSSILVVAASILISFFSARRGSNPYLTATFITLAFYLLSQKVVGYYYVMILPFALVSLLPARRFGLLAILVAGTAYISLSPYFASWADPNHLPVYAALGLANSLFFLALFIYLWRNLLRRGETFDASEGGMTPPRLSFLSLALFLAAAAAALLQPLVVNPTSPIRAPLVPPGLELNVVFAAIAFAAIILAILISFVVLTRRGGSETRPYQYAMFAAVLALAPLYFLTFTLTKESTAFVEVALKSLGL